MKIVRCLTRGKKIQSAYVCSGASRVSSPQTNSPRRYWMNPAMTLVLFHETLRLVNNTGIVEVDADDDRQPGDEACA